jgi:hypothetical protein
MDAHENDSRFQFPGREHDDPAQNTANNSDRHLNPGNRPYLCDFRRMRKT